MSRFPSHTIDDAPEGSRPILQKIADSSPTKRPLNVHAQMAHSPAVMAAYTALRAVTVEHGTLDPKVSWALNLATAAAVALNPSPRRAMTRISTACSWVNIGSLCKAAILAQVGHFYSGGVGQYYSGANTLKNTAGAIRSSRRRSLIWD